MNLMIKNNMLAIMIVICSMISLSNIVFADSVTIYSGVKIDYGTNNYNVSRDATMSNITLNATYATIMKDSYFWVKDDDTELNITPAGYISDLSVPAANYNIYLEDVDADYTIGMLPGYDHLDVTGLTEETATLTLSNISCNFTARTQNWVEPYIYDNAPTYNQQSNANSKPAFLLNNTGIINKNYTIRINGTLPLGVNVTANSTCNGAGAECITIPINLSSTYQRIAGLVPSNGYANITLWCGVSRDTPAGQRGPIEIFIKGSAI